MGRPQTLTDMTEQVFGKLTVIELDSRRGKQQRPYWLCKCECGNDKVIRMDRLTTGEKKDCGCVGKATVAKRNTETKTKHGLTYEPLFKTWNNIMYRCHSPKATNYKYYGGRGISVCKEWQESPQAFIEWAMNNGYEEHLTIDRENVNGNYEPENCRWITMAEQSQNKR